MEIGMISREEYGNGGRKIFRDDGTGRITGGRDGLPDDIQVGIAGDGIDSGGDGIRRCSSGGSAG